MIKVATMLCLELGAFPIICGLAIDVSTLALFNSTLGSRRWVAFFFLLLVLVWFGLLSMHVSYIIHVCLSVFDFRSLCLTALFGFNRLFSALLSTGFSALSLPFT